jgi:hypothetical protein
MLMKQITMIFTLLCCATLAFGQGLEQNYPTGIAKAESLFAQSKYKASALAYSDAFKGNGWLGAVPDRYNAACAWALAGNRDSAFSQLEKIALRAKYFNYKRMYDETNLKSLHSDKRWKSLISTVKKNKDQLYPNLDLNLSNELDSVHDEDSKYRLQMDASEAQYGWQSKQVKDLQVLMLRADSVNILKVSKILNKYGWLGADIVGSTGSSALFLVVQHASLKIQEKYLPLLQDAVKKGNAPASDLALLTDRIAVRNGKKQIYGSQIQQSPVTFTYSISPLEDPDHVDERRAKM